MMKLRWKKTAPLLLSLCLCFLLSGGLCIRAGAELLSPYVQQDGLSALLMTVKLSEDASGVRFRSTLTLDNRECTTAAPFRIALRVSDNLSLLPGSLPEGWEADGDGALLSLDLPVGQKAELRFETERSFLPETTVGETAAPEPTGTEPPAKKGSGCSSSLLTGGGIVLCLLAAVCAAGVLCRSRQGKKLLCLLLTAVTVGTCAAVLAPRAGAETTEHSFTIGTLSYVGEEKAEITAEITYRYEYIEKEVRKTTGLPHFDITYFCGPSGAELLNEATIADIAACGFTSMPVNGGSVEVNRQALALMKRYGLEASALNDPRVAGLLAASPEPSAEEVNAVIEAVVADYADCGNITGWYLMDEPAAAKFSILGKVTAAFRQYAPAQNVYINLFPNYATAKQLGVSTYKKYLDQFAEAVDPHYLSYDYYEFMKSKRRNGFFTNMEAVRACGLENGIDQGVIILLTQHLSYVNVTPEQIRWQVNSALAYGMRSVSYFTYYLDANLISQGWTNACVTAAGEKYPHYEQVQEVNRWLAVLGNELFSRTSTEVFHIRGKSVPSQTGEREYTGFGDLGAVQGGGFLVGFFDDRSFMLVNEVYKAGEDGLNALQAPELTRPLEVFDTASGRWIDALSDPRVTRGEDGVLTFTLGGGDGIYCRVKK